MYSYPYAAPQPQSPQQAGLEHVKGFFKKPICAIVAALYSLSVLIQVIIFGMNLSAMGRYGYSMDASSFFSLFLPVLIGLLICLAFWMIYIASLRSSPTSSPSAGLTILYTLAIIFLVLISLLSVLMIFMMIMFISTAGNVSNILTDLLDNPTIRENYGPFAANLQTLGYFLFFLVLLVLGVIIFAAISFLRFTGSAKKSLLSFTMYKGGSLACGVLCSLATIANIISLVDAISKSSSLSRYFESLSDYGLAPGIGVLTFISAVLSLLLTVCYAILFFSYYSYANRINANAPAIPGRYGPSDPQNIYSSYASPYAQPAQPTPYAAPYQAYQQPQSNSYAHPAQPTPYSQQSQPAPYSQPQSPAAPFNPYNTTPYTASAQPVSPTAPTAEIPVVQPVTQPVVPETPAVQPTMQSSAPEAPAVPEMPTVQPVMQPAAMETPFVPETPVAEPTTQPVVLEAPAVSEVSAEQPVMQPVVPEAPAVPKTPAAEPAVSEQEDTSVCPKCGSKILPGSKFCFRCGNRF